MRTRMIVLAVLLVAGAVRGAGEAPADGRWYGVYRMEAFPAYEKVKAPKGYEPVSISHYSRHGARYQDSPEAYTRPLEPLLRAREEQALTTLGESLCGRLEAHARNSAGHHGELTRPGWDQQRRNARLLRQAFPGVVSPRAEITACSSFSQRCMMSMTAFCMGLKENDPRLDVYAVTSRTLLDETNPGDRSNTRYVPTSKQPSPWDLSYDRILDTLVRESLADSILLRVFRDIDYVHSQIPSSKQYCASLYNLISGMACTGDGLLADDLFTDGELYLFYQAINYGFYEWSVLDGEKYKPILRSMVRDAREDLLREGPTVRLRFGHDTCLLGMLHFLGVETLGVTPGRWEDLPLTWNCFYTPMAAHFELIFYRHRRTGHVLVLPYLNGRVVSFEGLPSVSGPFVQWDDLCRRIAAL